MIRLLKIEFKKLCNSKVLLLSLLFIVSICVGISIIEFKNINFGVNEKFYTEFMLYNASFVIIKFFLPMLMVLLAASVWGGEYASGMIKTFMLCKCRKSDFYLCKTLFLIVCDIMVVMTTFVSLSALCIYHNGIKGITINEFIVLIKVYVLIAVGLLPIVLLTVFVSMLLDDFQKSFSCGVVFLLVSLSVDSVTSKSFLSITHFLSHSNLVYYSQEKAESFIVLIIYLVAIYFAGMFTFRNKDIWN